MSIRTVTLLRHGDIDAAGRLVGHTDHPLTGPGWQQMQAAWQALSEGGPPIDAVASSDLVRCAAFARTLPHAVEPAACWREAGFGHWDNSLTSGLPPGWADDYAAGRLTPPGGESMAAFASRVREAWQHWQSRTAGATHRVLVTHGGVIRLLLADTFGWSPAQARQIAVLRGGWVRWSVADGWPPCLLELRGPILLPANPGTTG